MRNSARMGILLAAILLLGGCASSRDSAPGYRILEAVVIERGYEPAAWGGRGSEGTVWYLVFEARDGEAIARFRLPVSELQYFRFHEGASVLLTLSN